MPFKKKEVTPETPVTEVTEPVVQQPKPVMQQPSAPKSTQEVWAESVRITKEKLDKQEKINFLIPMMEGETLNFETVQINGYQLTLQKGVLLEIPRDVATILAEKYKVAMTAGVDKRIDRSNDVASALS